VAHCRSQPQVWSSARQTTLHSQGQAWHSKAMISFTKRHFFIGGASLAVVLVVGAALLVQPVRASIVDAAQTIFGTAPPVTIINDTDRTNQLQEKLALLEVQVAGLQEARKADAQNMQQLTEQYALAVHEVAQVHDALVASSSVGRSSAVVSPVMGSASAQLPSSRPTTTASPAVKSGKVSINRGTITDLQTLPGIGPSYAQRIIEYREANGPFSSIDDLDLVQGIGPATIEKLRDKATL
jgi:comEA protein